MKRYGMSRVAVILTIICLVAGPSALFAGQSDGKAAPKKMNGTWSSIVTVPPNPIMGNTEDVNLPEMDTFSTSGTVITSIAAPIMWLTLDQVGTRLTLFGIGQGTWKMAGGHRYVSTQWRFLTDMNTGEPFGYLKIVVEWGLVDNNYAAGEYEVQLLALDMETLFTSGGVPAVIDGPFQMSRLPIEYLP